jgi:hypothetical protein
LKVIRRATDYIAAAAGVATAVESLWKGRRQPAPASEGL